jgi:hypothetical protein
MFSKLRIPSTQFPEYLRKKTVGAFSDSLEMFDLEGKIAGLADINEPVDHTDHEDAAKNVTNGNRQQVGFLNAEVFCLDCHAGGRMASNESSLVS